MRLHCAAWVAFVCLAFTEAIAGSGPPCWKDEIPTTRSVHVVSAGGGSINASGRAGQTLNVDDVNISVMLDGRSPQAIQVEVNVTNCSGRAITFTPEAVKLVVIGPSQDRPLRQIAYPRPTPRAITVAFNRIAFFRLQFEPDVYFTNIDHSEKLVVPFDDWQLNFWFQKQRIR